VSVSMFAISLTIDPSREVGGGINGLPQVRREGGREEGREDGREGCVC